MKALAHSQLGALGGETYPPLCLPTQAQAQSQSRGELSRMKALAHSQLGALRTELAELRNQSASELAAAAAQLRALGAVVCGDIGGALAIAAEQQGGNPLAAVAAGVGSNRASISSAPATAAGASIGSVGGGGGSGRAETGALLQYVVEQERQAVAQGLEALLLQLGGSTDPHGGSADPRGGSTQQQGGPVGGGSKGSLMDPVRQLQVRLGVTLPAHRHRGPQCLHRPLLSRPWLARPPQVPITASPACAPTLPLCLSPCRPRLPVCAPRWISSDGISQPWRSR